MEEVKKRKNYRNYTRSEKAIIRAYVELMSKKDKISVTDIVNCADLNRSTFYAHFKCVDDVREKIHSDVIEKLLGSIDVHSYRNSLENPYLAMSRIVEFIKSDEELYKTMLNTAGADKFLKQLRDIVIERYLSDEVILPHIKDRNSFEMNLRLFIGGYVSVLEDWAAGNVKMSLEECARIMSKSIENCIRVYIN